MRDSDAVAAWRERGLYEAEPPDDHVWIWRRRRAQASHVWALWQHESELQQIRMLLEHLRWHRARAAALAASRPRDAASFLRADIRRYVLLSAQTWLAMIWLGRQWRRLPADGWRAAAARALLSRMEELREDRVETHATIRVLRSRLPKAVPA